MTTTRGGEEQDAIVRRSMPELDSLRGVAILLVLLYHSFGFESRLVGLHGPAKLFVAACLQGWSGVNVFFALSGFLITGILLDSKDNPRYYPRFYWRRAVRILPPYLLLLSFFAFAHGNTVLQHDCSWPFLACALLYIANLAPILGVAMGYGALWSLAVEEQFYLLWPTLVRRLSPRALVFTALGVVAAAPLLRLYAFTQHLHYNAQYTWFVADGLAMGAIFAVLARSLPRAQVKRVVLGLFCGAVAMLAVGAPFGILTLDGIVGGTLRLTAVNVFSCGVLGAVLLLGTSKYRRFVRIRPLSFLGEISYGLYLYHILIFDICDAIVRHIWPAVPAPEGNFPVMVIRFAAYGTIAIVLSTLSRRTFEERFLALKARLAP